MTYLEVLKKIVSIPPTLDRSRYLKDPDEFEDVFNIYLESVANQITQDPESVLAHLHVLAVILFAAGSEYGKNNLLEEQQKLFETKSVQQAQLKCAICKKIILPVCLSYGKVGSSEGERICQQCFYKNYATTNPNS